MKKHYSLTLLQMVCLLLVSLFLQSCGGSTNLSIEGEVEPTETIEQEEGSQGRRKRAKIEEVDSGLEIIEMQQEPLPEASNICHMLPPEIWQEVFSHLDFEGVLSARAVSTNWNELITDTLQVSVVGVMNKARHIIDTRGWVKDKEINFRSKKLNQSIPETIPSFAFYHLMGSVSNLSQSFWPYLQETNVHTLDLSNNDLDNQGIVELVKVLPRTRIHTLDLGDNDIDDKDIIEVAKVLPYTQIHTLWLDYTKIGCKGVVELAKVLPQTQIHTLDLGSNSIRDASMIELIKLLPQTQIHTLCLSGDELGDKTLTELAKVLPKTQIHTLDLGYTNIGYVALTELAKVLPKTQIHILDLGYNNIGYVALTELAKVLQQTQIHTLYLSRNQISEEAKYLLRKKYPNINIITD